MNPKQYIARFREQAFDLGDPPHWTDASLLGYLNEARYEAARRSRLIEDASTAEICKLTLKAGKAIYDIDRRVIFIRRIKIDGEEYPLGKVDLRYADRITPGWESRGSATPTAWLPWGDYQIRLIDVPDADYVANMIVVREPLAELNLADGEDEDFPARVQAKLVDYVKGRALMEQDKTEKYRPGEAAACMALFDKEFGPPSSILNERWINRRHGYDDLEGLS